MTRLAKTPARLTQRFGEFVTLERTNAATGANPWTQGTQTVSRFYGAGAARNYTPREIRGGILERDKLVIVDPSTMIMQPRDGDRIALGILSENVLYLRSSSTHLYGLSNPPTDIFGFSYPQIDAADWWRVINCDPVRLTGAVVLYRVQVRR